MSSDDKARRLADHLQTVMEEAEGALKKNPAVREALSAQEVRALQAVGRRDRCFMGAIADAICLSLSSATGLIDRLVEKKLVRRDRSREDRRVVEVELTEQGREVHEAAVNGQAQFARGLLKALSPEEQDALLALFRKVSDRIKTEKARA